MTAIFSCSVNIDYNSKNNFGWVDFEEEYLFNERSIDEFIHLPRLF